MISKLEWDSKFFNVPIFNLDASENQIFDIDEMFSKYDDGVIQSKVNVEDWRFFESLIRCNFSIQGAGISYIKTIEKRKIDTEIKRATKADIHTIQNIVKGNFIQSRYKDDFFGCNSADRLYSHWIESSVCGQFDDCCLIKEDQNGTIIGFVTVKKLEKSIKVGLIAVDKSCQQKGIGKQLMEMVEIYALKYNKNTIRVTTQFDNQSARKMYRSMNYNEYEIFFWLYYKLGSIERI
jgi:dTDP-4-amino-4,6-dideoxy-D-galactose acyltransferase